MNLPSRDAVISIWKKYNDDAALFKHALAVEAAMRYYADIKNADADEWGKVGLLHDIDYGRWPEEHCKKAPELLKAEGLDDEVIRAVVSHGYGLVSDVKPESELEKTLYAVDELTGFVAACALVRPSKSVTDLEVKSVKKKWKTPAFAAGVDRTVIEKGAQMMGLTIEELIEGVINAMRENHKELGL